MTIYNISPFNISLIIEVTFHLNFQCSIVVSMFNRSEFCEVAVQAEAHRTITLCDCITSWESSSSAAVTAHGDRVAVKVHGTVFK